MVERVAWALSRSRRLDPVLSFEVRGIGFSLWIIATAIRAAHRQALFADADTASHAEADARIILGE